MDKEKLLGKAELLGLALVLIASAVWMMEHFWASVMMAAGTVILSIGRFFQTPFYAKYLPTDSRELTLRRLYHQRVFGIMALVVSAALMFTPQGFYFGLYVAPSSWLITFVVFVVIEVYTAFRISSVDKD